MIRRILSSPIVASSALAAPVLITFALATLLASFWLTGLPLVTTMAVLTLGATFATVDRFRHAEALGSIMSLHAATYLSLYVMFVCATLYAPSSDVTHGLGRATGVDLGLSVLPMAISLRHIVDALRLRVDSQR
ncbi:MAG TPA: hypothetical protein VHU84_00835 [Lacipirellulaceae bacterium]|jgi:hypothetical protein|nr:hypothetical protein [Lacipirellulaceae bacterium]